MENFRFNYQSINSASIISATEYQRPVDCSRVKRIVSNFDKNLVNLVKVSFRDGKYYVFDGQHTLKALVLRNKGKNLMVDCKVFYGMTFEDEARMFAEQNGISKIVCSSQKLCSLYAAKDVDVVAFHDLLESMGIRCTFKHKGIANYQLVCYKTAYDIFIKYGREHFKELIDVIIGAWSGEAASLQKEVVAGVSKFMIAYRGEYNSKFLVNSLTKVSPITIVRDGKASITAGSNRYASIILNIYNRGRKTNRLEDKFR